MYDRRPNHQIVCQQFPFTSICRERQLGTLPTSKMPIRESCQDRTAWGPVARSGRKFSCVQCMHGRQSKGNEEKGKSKRGEKEIQRERD